MYDWLLLLHVLGAFAMVGSIFFYWGLILAGGRMVSARQTAAVFPVARPVGIVVAVGSLVTVAFGIWLTLYVDGYELWDPWILGALVLWAISLETGRRSGAAYTKAGERARELATAGGDAPTAELEEIVRRNRGLLMHSLTTVALVAALALMIFKPGAP